VDLIVDDIREELEAKSSGEWIEPALGGGDIVKALSGKGIHPSWTTVDIDPGSNPMICGDGISVMSEGRWDVCFSNPPYSRALDFASSAVSSCSMTILLLRLNWLASSKRCSWLRANTPSVYVIPNRPSFTSDGRTDATDYAWFVWSEDRTPTVTILPETPKHRRNQWRHQLTMFTSKDM